MKLAQLQSSKYSLALIALLLPLLPACGPRYQVRELKPLTHDLAQYEETKAGVSLKVRVLNPEEANELFDGRGHYLFDRKNPVYPVHCSVTNITGQAIALNKENIGLPCVDSGKAFQMMRVSSAQRNSAFALGALCAAVGAIVLTGVLLVTTSNCPCPCYLLPLIPLGGIIGALYVVSVPVSSVYTTGKCEEANKVLDADLIKKQVANVITIEPGQTVSCILFADGKKFQPQFNLSVGAHEQRITFDVDLRKAIQSEFVKA